MCAILCLGWFTLATEAESESEAQGALRSSVNQKVESEAELEARRNRSQKDQKSFFFFRFRFRLRLFRRADSHNFLPIPTPLTTALPSLVWISPYGAWLIDWCLLKEQKKEETKYWNGLKQRVWSKRRLMVISKRELLQTATNLSRRNLWNLISNIASLPTRIMWLIELSLFVFPQVIGQIFWCNLLIALLVSCIILTFWRFCMKYCCFIFDFVCFPVPYRRLSVYVYMK